MSAEWFSIGHTTLAEERTGCTVILFDEPTPAAVDVRGGAPGTRETNVLDASTRRSIDAIVLSGGSAFGLQSAHGVMQFLVEKNRGHPTSAGPVPIVPGAIVFDLAVGSAHAPTSEDGFLAAANATQKNWETGRVGAGTGVTVAKLGGNPKASGLGIATTSEGAIVISAVVVLNAVGDILNPANASYLAQALDGDGTSLTGRQLAIRGAKRLVAGENTTIGAIMISEPLDHFGLTRCCIAAHDALARCVSPAHTVFDGDTFFAVAKSRASVNATTLLAICAQVEVTVEQAIVSIFDA